jgi:sortase A
MAAFGLVLVASLALPADAAVAPAHAVPAAGRQPTSSPSQESGVVVSHVRIPSIGVDEEVRSGISLSVIDQGVAHWAGTSAPGESGNVVLAGHRSTYTRPFEDLDHLEVGDLVYLEDGDGFEVMYRVSDSFIVAPEDIWISYDLGKPMVTMFACHPKGSAKQRIVVQAELVAGRRVA